MVHDRMTKFSDEIKVSTVCGLGSGKANSPTLFSAHPLGRRPLPSLRPLLV